ncbi:MAG TPA: DNA-directed RNA polymerase subunit beta', partial [Melioribacteraceae bacterium]|nr:DNA-directed RNA polymerase subunit beta' [Melioribacteraceae bacterium]
RTFHLGGTASRVASQSAITVNTSGRVQYEKIDYVTKVDAFGLNVNVVLGRRGSVGIYDEDNRQIKRYDIPYGAELLVNDGDEIKNKQELYRHDPYNMLILTDIGGRVSFVDMIENVTMQQVADEQTGHVQKVVLETKDKTLVPGVMITDVTGETKVYNMPNRAYLSVEEGEFIKPGTILAKISKASSKTKDITGGLPRVTELFEARSPHEPSIVSDIEGIVKFGNRKKGSREIIIESLDGSITKTYNVPYGKHILVNENDEIPAGEKITDGPIDAHDVLRIQGPMAVQEYLLNEIQDVYRVQGVKINDKHIEIIVRQMLQKLKIVNSGDTSFIEEDFVDRVKVIEENKKLENFVVVVDPGQSKFKVAELITRARLREVNTDLARRGRTEVKARDAEPATFDNILLGITSAALSTESFISAASFQETTKVLTNAATEARADHLIGLKENVVMGHLIPAGTGLKKYRKIILSNEEKMIEEEPENEVEEGTAVE